jgi:hypothetical protein
VDRDKFRAEINARIAPFIDLLVARKVAPWVLLCIGADDAGRTVDVLGVNNVTESDAIILIDSALTLLRAKHLKSN